MSVPIYIYLCLYVCVPPGVGRWGPGSRFTGVQGDQRRGKSSRVGVGGMRSGWRWRRGSVQMTGGPGGETPWLARGPSKADLAASIFHKGEENLNYTFNLIAIGMKCSRYIMLEIIKKKTSS